MSRLCFVDTDACKRTCAQCGKGFRVRYPSSRKRFCSYSCSAKSRPSRPGNANANWRGGKTKHPLYDIYMEMIGRCERPTHKRYADYGGRGIAVCQQWRDDFWAFVADMGPRPDGLTLDRSDNNKGYSPDNCWWATYSEQVNNRRPLPSRFSAADRDKMRTLYKTGLSQQVIAEQFGTHGTHVGMILRGLGVEARQGAPGRLSEDERHEVCALYRSGLTQEQIAARVGVSRSLISRTIRKERQGAAA